jgi:DNA-binding MarR family transcriptional regulator
MGRKRISRSKDEIVHVLDQYIHNQTDRRVMVVYLTDYPDSLERLAEVCDLSVSTVKRIINRNSFIYKHFE